MIFDERIGSSSLVISGGKLFMEICSIWSTLNCWMRVLWIWKLWVPKSWVTLLGLFLLFVSVYSCRSWLKLPTSLSELFCFRTAQVYGPAVPIHTDGSESSKGVGYAAVFPDFEVFFSLPAAALFFIVELHAIFLAFSRISFHDSNNFVIYCDSRSALQALGSRYKLNSLVWRYNVFFVTFTSVESLSPSGGSLPTLGFLATKRLMFWLKGPSSYPWAIIMLYFFMTTFSLYAVPSVHPGSLIAWQ